MDRKPICKIARETRSQPPLDCLFGGCEHSCVEEHRERERLEAAQRDFAPRDAEGRVVVVSAQTLRVGGRYNWRGQPERLVYLGMCEPRNGRWHQFALVGKPGEVWCEVLGSDLRMLEETVGEGNG